MALSRQHEIHTRRLGRNIGVGLLLVALIILMLGLTVVKVTQGDQEINTQETE